MKRCLFLLAAIVLLAAFACDPGLGPTPEPEPDPDPGIIEITLFWDPVNTLTDGSTLPEGSTLRYEVYSIVYPEGATTSLGTVDETQFVFEPPEPAKQYKLGVRSVLKVGDQMLYSEPAWSDLFLPMTSAKKVFLKTG